MLRIVSHIPVHEGVAEVAFPDSIRKDHFQSSIIVRAVWSEPEPRGENLVLVVSNVSFHQLQLDKFAPNVLGFLEPSSSLSALHEIVCPFEVPINLARDKIELFFVDRNGGRVSLNGHIVVEVRGHPIREVLL